MIEMHYVYTYEDSIMKPTKHFLKRGKKIGGRSKNIMEGVSLLKVYHMYL
jgi:hypothetical protein